MNPTANKAVTSEWLRSYHEDGAGVLRNVIPAEWIERMRLAIEKVIHDRSPLAMDLAGKYEGAFFNDLFLWRWQEEFRAFIFASPLGKLAGEILETSDVRLFYDQLFVMEPGGGTPTPWHQDQPYWPIKGPDIISIWVPFDFVTPENGVVTYVKGSHHWNALIRPESPRLKAAGVEDSVAQGKNVITFDPSDASHEFLSWDLSPGDVLVHDGLTVHGANANTTSDRRRRALAVRFVGPQTRYDPRPGTWIHDIKVREHLPLPDIEPGAPLSGELFPHVNTL